LFESIPAPETKQIFSAENSLDLNVLWKRHQMFSLSPFVKYGDKYRAVTEFSQFHASVMPFFCLDCRVSEAAPPVLDEASNLSMIYRIFRGYFYDRLARPQPLKSAPARGTRRGAHCQSKPSGTFSAD
jgi:hypothetical protein